MLRKLIGPLKQLSYIPRRFRARFASDGPSGPDRFMRKSGGVLHVGANEGQERHIYHQNGMRVIWVEPIPDVFEKLQANLREYPRQTGLQYLLTDVEGKDYEFHIASNGGASSSIFDFHLHGDIWPEVKMERTVQLRSSTLASMVEEHKIDIDLFSTLAMDTQGSELLVLKGAGDLLDRFRYIKTEVADFEVYAGCCTLKDLQEYLGERGFMEIERNCFAEREQGGKCYDVLYERKR